MDGRYNFGRLPLIRHAQGLGDAELLEIPEY